MTKNKRNKPDPARARLAVAAAILLAAGAAWWWLGGAERAAQTANVTTAPAVDSPPAETQTAVQTAPRQEADRGSGAQTNSIASSEQTANTVAGAIDELVSTLGDFRDPDARIASRTLIAMGPGIADDVVSALERTTREEQQARNTGGSSAARARLETRKLQLIVVLSAIGAPRHAPALLAVARASDPTSLAQPNVTIALGRMGAVRAARDYAHEVLGNDQLPVMQARALLGHLVHFPGNEDADLARRFMRTPASDQLRDLGLLLAARTGLGDEVSAMASQLVQTASQTERDFYTLLALAEAMPPAEFEVVAAGSPLATARPARRYFEQALAHSRFTWGDNSQKQAQLGEQLTATQSEPVIAALRYVLENDRTDWLFEYSIVRDVRAARLAMGLRADGSQQLKVAPRFASLVGFTGYRIDVSGATPVVVRNGG